MNTVNEPVTYFEKQDLDCGIIVAADGGDGTCEVVAHMSQANSRLKEIGSVERRGNGCGICQAAKIAEGDVIGFADAGNKTPVTEPDNFLSYRANKIKIPIDTGNNTIELSVLNKPRVNPLPNGDPRILLLGPQNEPE